MGADQSRRRGSTTDNLSSSPTPATNPNRDAFNRPFETPSYPTVSPPQQAPAPTYQRQTTLTNYANQQSTTGRRPSASSSSPMRTPNGNPFVAPNGPAFPRYPQNVPPPAYDDTDAQRLTPTARAPARGRQQSPGGRMGGARHSIATDHTHQLPATGLGIPPRITSTTSTMRSCDANEEYAECPICFDELYKEPQAVLTWRGRRCCQHVFHKRCVGDMRRARQKHCPLCRRDFDDTLDVPDPTKDPRGWFRVVDLDGNGKLDRKEVIEVLKAALPVDWKKLEARLDNLWRQWDLDGSGFISEREMLDPQRGLLVWVRNHMDVRRNRGPPPDIRREKSGWFRYWDENSNGSLDKEEVCRAFIKTFNLSRDSEKVAGVRALLDALWVEFDPDGSGGIDEGEFVQREGLADTILANIGR
uniref:Calmodulin n=1 Tax=Chromera velia CCMP2878 TaxID=1169474 RepID=A0A0G4H6Z1_9ALVE|mmetsp:Transcript_53994/g.105584  ORF Transcript_53994/g.105584 Transcript_53994/m.105584 type:complete len:416 (-) Transcript_53994:238-1485(-)|eukprot:Cvel_24945.t1-p1 / transcript=Cvel_24945.t1 / gene=Cvel_24945 / organism=Chromera_velia_CCMP2878 / gene_product=Neurocalcin-delta, putative / transcript_product=Neurocalcin-delta, putative / location=Cvel_scaffold2760:16576-19013(+) / protein_length=415 / sequence_SO=supercontig / SO=protein_coding / is_pseudo=false